MPCFEDRVVRYVLMHHHHPHLLQCSCPVVCDRSLIPIHLLNKGTLPRKTLLPRLFCCCCVRCRVFVTSVGFPAPVKGTEHYAHRHYSEDDSWLVACVTWHFGSPVDARCGYPLLTDEYCCALFVRSVRNSSLCIASLPIHQTLTEKEGLNLHLLSGSTSSFIAQLERSNKQA